MVLLALGAVGLFALFRSVGDSEFEFDIGEGGTVEFGDQADTYGDDPHLDSLWDGCAGGDMAACDQLYLESPIGSEYEDFGDTCGRRQDAGGLCDQ